MQISKKKSESKRFKAHYNEALGKYYGNKADYLADMKAGGYEPYEKGAGEKVLKESRKEYKPSDTARGLLNEIHRSTGRDGKVRLGSVAIDAMKKHGVVFTNTNQKSDCGGRDTRHGGFK